MSNTAINHYASATVHTLNKIKNKISYYVAILVMIFGSTFGTMNAAYAGDVTNDGAAITSSHVTTLVDAADGTLTVNGTKTATLDISVGKHASGGTAIELGDASAEEAAVLDINTTAAIGAITIDANIRTKVANTAGTLSIDSTSAGAAPQVVTINGLVGYNASNAVNATAIMDIITVGTDGTTGGEVVFAAGVNSGTIAISGGDASETAKATFSDVVVGAITMNHGDSGATAVFDGTTRTVAASITAGADNEGTVQVTGTGITFTGAQGATGLASLDVDATTSSLVILYSHGILLDFSHQTV